MNHFLTLFTGWFFSYCVKLLIEIVFFAPVMKKWKEKKKNLYFMCRFLNPCNEFLAEQEKGV